MNGKAAVKEYYKTQSDYRAERLGKTGFNSHRDIYEEHAKLFGSLISSEAPYGHGLDIGTGPGVWAEFLADYCDGVLGVDFVEENVANATAAAERLGLSDKVSYQVGDAEELEGIPRETFDLATQVSVLQHLPNKRKSLESAYAVLKPDGRFLLLVQNRCCLYNYHLRGACGDPNTFGINEYSELGDLKRTLESVGFEIEAVRPCWLSVRDLLYVGTNHRILRFANPLRRPLMGVLGIVERILNRFSFLDPLFRELVFLARKPRG